MRQAGEVIWYEVMRRAAITLHDPAVIPQRGRETDRVIERHDQLTHRSKLSYRTTGNGNTP